MRNADEPEPSATPKQQSDVMTRNQLAATLSITIANAPWTRHGIRDVLQRRLPAPQRALASSLADGILKCCGPLFAPAPRIIAKALLKLRPFDRLYDHCQRTRTWPAQDFAPQKGRPIRPFADLDLPALATPQALADWLLLTPGQLDYLADPIGRAEQAEIGAINHYTYHIGSKKTGGPRLIEAPKMGLKAVQRLILRGILDKVPTHPDAFGFVKGRNCLMAAGRHASEEAVLRLDIRNFFTAIRATRIHGLFRCLGYPRSVADLLTGLTTVRTPPRVLDRLPGPDRPYFRAPHLPQGAPTSPALGNLVTYAMDRRLAGLARQLGLNYSRYADDLTLSGDRHAVGKARRLAERIVTDEGFRVNRSKTRIMRQCERQQVTGLVVNAHVNIPRRDYDRLKADIHACGKPDDPRAADPDFRASVAARIGWVEQVNPRRGAKLRQKLMEIEAAAGRLT